MLYITSEKYTDCTAAANSYNELYIWVCNKLWLCWGLKIESILQGNVYVYEAVCQQCTIDLANRNPPIFCFYFEIFMFYFFLPECDPTFLYKCGVY